MNLNQVINVCTVLLSGIGTLLEIFFITLVFFITLGITTVDVNAGNNTCTACYCYTCWGDGKSPTSEYCGTCGGDGKADSIKTCTTCSGSGKIKIIKDDWSAKYYARI